MGGHRTRTASRRRETPDRAAVRGRGAVVVDPGPGVVQRSAGVPVAALARAGAGPGIAATRVAASRETAVVAVHETVK